MSLKILNYGTENSSNFPEGMIPCTISFVNLVDDLLESKPAVKLISNFLILACLNNIFDFLIIFAAMARKTIGHILDLNCHVKSNIITN